MFQRMSRLLFGEVKGVSKDLEGPKPTMLEAEEEGWLLVSMPEGDTIIEAGPLDDILIDLPGLSVYSSHGDQAATEEGIASLVDLTCSVRMVEPPLPVARSGVPRTGGRSSAPHTRAVTKVTQVGRVQRAQARADRRHLARSRGQRKDAAWDRLPRRMAHLHGAVLHQPGLRTCNH